MMDDEFDSAAEMLWKTRQDILNNLEYEIASMNSYSNRFNVRKYVDNVHIDRHNIIATFNNVCTEVENIA